MKIKVILLLFVLTNSVLCFGQKKKGADTSRFIEQTKRIEFEIGKYDLDFHIVSGRSEGMMVVKETTVRNEGGFGWVLTKLDTAFTIKWEKLAIIPFNYNLKGWDYSAGYYYLLFTKSSYTPQDLILQQIDQLTGKVTEYEISTVFPIELSHFEVLENTIILAGLTNFRPAVLTYDLDDQKPKVLPGIYGGNSELVDVRVDRDAGVFSVIMLERMIDKRYTISVKTFTAENMLIQSNTLDPDSRNSLIDGATTDFQGGFQYIAGTYSSKNTQYSRGLYLAKFVNGNQQFIRYINYADLENFFGYMRERREQRIKDRIERRRSKGKKLKFNYKLLIHDMIQQDNQYILIGEAYYPRYSNYQQYGGPPIGAIPRMYNQISGYKYTHAVVVAFNQNGNMLWDHSFEIDDAFTLNLQEFVTVNVFNDRVELLYLEKNLIRSKVIMGDDVLEGKTYTPVKLPSDTDEVRDKDPDLEGLEKWYDDVHYAFGEQTIERKTIGKSRREVFYINKVRYKLR